MTEPSTATGEQGPATGERGAALTVFAILFALLAISNFLKPLQLLGGETGFVLFGIRLTGLANTIFGPLFGAYLALYAWGIWMLRRFALPMGHFYATYVVLNLAMFSLVAPKPADAGAGYQIFILLYAVIAIGVSVSAAVLLTRRKAELR